MTLHTDEFIEGHVLAAADVAEVLYEVPPGARARVHEFVVYNDGDVECAFSVYLDGDELAGRYFGGLMQPGETWFRPLGTWREARVVRGVAEHGGVIQIRASGSLLSL